MGDAHLKPTILDLNFIRPGSLGLTSRPPDEKPMWASDDIKTIEVSLGLCPHPLVLHVREFVPGPADALARTWVAPDGRTPRSVPLAPYTIADVAETAAVVGDYIRDNCLCFADVAHRSHPAVLAVYARVPAHVQDLREAVSLGSDGADREQLELMDRYCQLWFGIRNMMGSAWICGSETLGMQPVDEEGYPLRGKISVPRQVVQTVGCLLDAATRPRQARFLDALRAALQPHGDDRGRQNFFTLFLVVFVLLHECEDISKDRERYARQNFMTVRFSLPQYVVALHESAHQLIGHWLTYASSVGVDFSSRGKLEASLAFLHKAKRDLVMESYDAVFDGPSVSIRAGPDTWTKDLCFVSHMFGVPWAADALYQGN